MWVSERVGRRLGENIERLAGQMTSVIYALLKKDQELLAHLILGATPPELQFYDASLHHMSYYQLSK